MATEAMPFNVS